MLAKQRSSNQLRLLKLIYDAYGEFSWPEYIARAVDRWADGGLEDLCDMVILVSDDLIAMEPMTMMIGVTDLGAEVYETQSSAVGNRQ